MLPTFIQKSFTQTRRFDRYFLVMVFDSKGRSVMKGKCFNSGYSSNLSDVVPRMIDSFLTDFPGDSDKTKTYLKR